MGKSKSDMMWPTPNTRCAHNGINESGGVRDTPELGRDAMILKGCKNWATPNTMDFLPTRSDDGVLKQATGARKGRTRPANLREQVDNRTCEIYKESHWPTPNTPSGGAKADGSAPQGMNGGKGPRNMMKGQFKPGAKLNPDWVEQLMGLPPGWTQLSGAEPGGNRIDRLRLLGNGVVPATAEKAFRTLLGRIENERF